MALTDTARRLLPWLVAVGFFMESLDTTILNTAVPAIALALKVAPLSMKAVLASYTGLCMVYRHLPNYREQRNYPLDIVGLVLFGTGISLLSYVLEVFGETSLSGREMLGLLAIAVALLATYGLHTTRTLHPLLRLGLVRIRTFRVSISGNLFTMSAKPVPPAPSPAPLSKSP